MNGSILNHGFLFGFILLLGIFVGRSLLIAGGALVLARRSSWLRARQVVLAEREKTDWQREFGRGLLVLTLDAFVAVGFVYCGLLILAQQPSAASISITVLALFVWMEIYFYFLHRSLHHPKLFWIHRYHHQGHGTTPWTSLSFTFSERAFLLIGTVGAPALASHWVPIPLDGWALYFLLNFVLNVYGHLNAELVPTWFTRSPALNWMNTSTSHGMHHLRYRGNYGLFTPFLDRWLGTDFQDYPARLEAVLAGKGAELMARRHRA